MPVIEYVECDTAPLPLGPEMQALADSRNPAQVSSRQAVGKT